MSERRRLMMSQDSFPVGYRRLSYIRGTGTQYLLTGLTTNQKYKFEYVGRYTGDTTKNRFTGFYVRYGQSHTATYGIANDNNYLYYPKITSSNSYTWTQTNKYIGLDEHLFIADLTGSNIVYTVDDFNVSCPSYYYLSSALPNIPLFAVYNYDTGGMNKISHIIGFILKWCKIYNQNGIIKDYVPALRTSDSKPGLIDLLTNQFLTNQGTGEFSYE